MQRPDRAALSLPTDAGCRVCAAIRTKTYQAVRHAIETSVNISRVAKISAAKRPQFHSAGGSMLVVADGDACFLVKGELECYELYQ